MAVAFKYAARPDFKEYAIQLIKNAQALCSELQKLGYKVQHYAHVIDVLLLGGRAVLPVCVCKRNWSW